jgi:hypothetical protein
MRLQDFPSVFLRHLVGVENHVDKALKNAYSVFFRILAICAEESFTPHVSSIKPTTSPVS